MLRIFQLKDKKDAFKVQGGTLEIINILHFKTQGVNPHVNKISLLSP